MAQQPTVGRIVVYHCLSTRGLPESHPAIVTRVGDGWLNLHVFFDAHVSEPRCSVEERTPETVGMSWSWPERV